MAWPAIADTTFLFAHKAYQLAEEWTARSRGGRVLVAKAYDELEAQVGEADVVVVSMMWRNELLARAPRLKFVQSVSAGMDQFDKAAFAARGVRLASAQGANERAVAEHAMALILAHHRHLHLGRDAQTRAHWRPMIADRGAREEEVGGKTLAVVGLGRIGQRLARLASAFDMRVVGVRRDTSVLPPGVAEVVDPTRLHAVLGQADIVALTCPLTPETTKLIDAAAFAAMRPGALIVNVARGKVVDEHALIAALAAGRIAGAALDCTEEEPLPADSPLWRMANVIVTPHSAGETRAYEANVVDILSDNLDRLSRDEHLRNGVV